MTKLQWIRGEGALPLTLAVVVLLGGCRITSPLLLVDLDAAVDSSEDRPSRDGASRDGASSSTDGGDSSDKITSDARVDPCVGMTCNAAPANFCVDSMHLETYDTIGSCSDGACSYHSQVVTCNCTAGSCATDPCVSVTCAMPPAAACSGATTRRTYAAAGTCSGGSCSYAPMDTPCPFGCSNGACTADPCAGVTCNMPPANSCPDAMHLVAYDKNGTCALGACSYHSQAVACSCSANACATDACAMVMCGSPLAASCVGSATQRTYAKIGTCNGGSCSYAPTDTSCSFGCVNNACKADLCTGVTCDAPPASICTNSTTRRTYGSGTCSGGSCSYAPTDASCQFGCGNGACKADPCAGVVCNAPPANSCRDATHLVGYDTTGACAAGKCSYGSQVVACNCVANACSTDPCANVTCNTPPPANCPTSSTRRTYAPSGTCTGGSCTYAPTDTACSFGCSNGTCKPDPCAGVTCNAPPAPSCPNTSTRRAYAQSGTCSQGSCSYAPADTPCPASQECSGGRCVCDAASCSTACCANTCCPKAAPNSAATCDAFSQCQSTCAVTLSCTNGRLHCGSWNFESGTKEGWDLDRMPNDPFGSDIGAWDGATLGVVASPAPPLGKYSFIVGQDSSTGAHGDLSLLDEMFCGDPGATVDLSRFTRITAKIYIQPLVALPPGPFSSYIVFHWYKANPTDMFSFSESELNDVLPGVWTTIAGTIPDPQIMRIGLDLTITAPGFKGNVYLDNIQFQ